MRKIEDWTKNPEGTYDVTVVHSGRRYTYLLKSAYTFYEFRRHILHQRLHSAFALLPAGKGLAETDAESHPREPGHGPGRLTLSDGRKRPDPAEARPIRAHTGDGGRFAETGWLEGPDASPLIAPADNRSVMLYPF